MRFTVPADAGLNVNVAPLATEMFPFIEWPGVPVMLKLSVPWVIVKLLIDTADPPVVVLAALTLYSKFAYVRPENEGVRLPSCRRRLPAWNTATPLGALAPNGLLPVTCTYTDPLAKTDALKWIVPKALPKNEELAVIVDPLLNVRLLASTGITLVATPDRTIPPLMDPVLPVFKNTMVGVEELTVRVEPD